MRAGIARRGAAVITAPAVAAIGSVVVLMLSGCGGPGDGPGGAPRACPAVDYGRTLVVRLADDWPPTEGRTVVARCSSPCGQVQQDGDELAREVSGVLTGSSAELWMMDMPDSVVVTVLGPKGQVAEVEQALTWERVGGTEECGGPMEAVVVVPAA